MSAYPYKFRLWEKEKIKDELAYAAKKLAYWERRVEQLSQIQDLAKKRYQARDTYYTESDLLEADRIEKAAAEEAAQQAAELAEADRIERKTKRAFDKIDWFFGRGETYPYFLTREWRDSLPSWQERKHVDELYQSYRDLITEMIGRNKRLFAEELVGDFLFMIRQIQIGQPMFKKRRR